MENVIGPILFASCLLYLLPQLGAAKDNAWGTLKEVTWHRTYTLVDREGSCTTGEIVAITEQAITLKRLDRSAGKTPTTSTDTIERQKVLRIMDGHKVVDVVYSGKSSWADVEAMQHIGSDETVLLVTRSGKRYKGKPVEVAEASLKLVRLNKTTQILKDDISQVYYVREKPVSASLQYSAQEMGIVRSAIMALPSSHTAQGPSADIRFISHRR